MAAVRKVHAENGIAGLQDRQIDGHVRLAAGMRLNVDVLGAEKFFGALDREVLDHVDEFATAVISAARVAFGVFVREDGTRRFENGLVREVLRCDQFKPVGLPPRLVLNSGVDFRIEVLERENQCDS